MSASKSLLLLVCGISLGAVGMSLFSSPPQQIQAASNDRYQDYIISTGPVVFNPQITADGVWMLDYRSGKLLGTVIDPRQGKILAWADVDLVEQFGIKPKQDVHFVMTTGNISQGQSALYLAEVVTGKMGVYTMGASNDGQGIVIRQHHLTTFRGGKPAVEK